MFQVYEIIFIQVVFHFIYVNCNVPHYVFLNITEVWLVLQQQCFECVS